MKASQSPWFGAISRRSATRILQMIAAMRLAESRRTEGQNYAEALVLHRLIGRLEFCAQVGDERPHLDGQCLSALAEGQSLPLCEGCTRVLEFESRF